MSSGTGNVALFFYFSLRIIRLIFILPFRYKYILLCKVFLEKCYTSVTFSVEKILVENPVVVRVCRRSFFIFQL